MPENKLDDRLVLFDLDGTITDTIPIIVASFRHTLTVHTGQAPDDDTLTAGIGKPLADQFAELTDHPVAPLIATYGQRYLEETETHVPLFDDIEEQVHALANLVQLGIVTGKSRRGMLRTLDVIGMADTFAITVAACDTEHGKPHPQPILHALGQTNIDATRACYIGDSPHDMQSGRAAGVKTVAALWGPFARHTLEAHDPTLYVEKPRDLAKQVHEMFAG